jgi:arylsulfatase A-like enzyme
MTTALLALSALTAATAKPNVLFISIDDLNDWVGFLGGHPQASTPNLDRFAESGVVFENAYCPAPSCNPSRTAILTGRAPQNTGMYANGQVWREVLPDAVTLPQHLRSQGYVTGGAGKIFHHFSNDPASWDHYWPSKIRQFPRYIHPKPKDKSQFPRWKNIYVSFDWGPIDVPVEETGDFKSVQYVIDQLDQPHDKPFFLTCGIYRPHVPWYVPRRFFDQFPLDEVQLPPAYNNDLDDLPAAALRMLRSRPYYRNMIEHDQQKQTVQAYLASIAYMDEIVGRLLDALEKSAHADNTYVVFWSDHGWQLGEKEHYRKFALWEDIAHVPLIFAGPDIEAGRCDEPVNLLDLYPTLLSMLGLDRADNLDGHDLTPLVQNPELSWPHPSITTLADGAASVRTKNWRYIRYADGGEELYDHRIDPNEWTNLATVASSKETLDEHRALFPAEFHPRVKTEPLEEFRKRRAGGG